MGNHGRIGYSLKKRCKAIIGGK
ncbi:hypothetical protein Golax_023825 [Gossypium laxum]|uniref:Uncharacterized protein n=1 Tax=Gossypium laxum TaxID=34288 RepID=A0A7J8ZAT6_9ROSI|nr:hypothetical protein [Gossypium laxum]